MNPNVGSVIAEGVAQITVAVLRQNAMRPEEVPGFMNNVRTALLECVSDVDAAVAQVSTAVESPAPVAENANVPAAEPAPARASTARPRAEQPEKSEETVAAAAQSVAADTVAEPVAQQEQETVELSDDPDSPNYRFKHLSRQPRVPKEESVQNDYIVCLFDGVKKKMIKRWLKTRYGMTPEQYKRHFDLPEDYPMVAPGYSGEKRQYAIKQGFGKTNKKERATPAQAKVSKRKRTRATAAAE